MEAVKELEPILGILCGGAPVPGLNDVLAASVIYAVQLGWKVLGFHGGFNYLATSDLTTVLEHTVELTTDYVAPYTAKGGSFLTTDRFDPSKDGKYIDHVLQNLSQLHVRYLLVIGGNNKIMCVRNIAQKVDPSQLQVISIPKTIDNDIAIPKYVSTFGFHSARAFATKLVINLVEDCRSAPRWFVVELMGKQTGHLALSVANAAGAHLCIIPEDFGDNEIELKDICDIFETAIYKRMAYGKNYGVCIISEGLISKMSSNALSSLYKKGYTTHDSDGNIILDDAELSRAVCSEMQARLGKRGIPMRVNPKKIGYELRGCGPNSYDAIYGRDLGYAAVEGLRIGKSDCTVIWDNGDPGYIPTSEIIHLQDGKIIPRMVDLEGEEYIISRLYGWQLREEDLEAKRLAVIARAARLTPDEFVALFGHVMLLTVC